MRKLLFAVLGLTLTVLTQGAQAQMPAPALGMPLGEEEIARLSITVFPDGRNLPPGQGSVLQG